MKQGTLRSVSSLSGLGFVCLFVACSGPSSVIVEARPSEPSAVEQRLDDFVALLDPVNEFPDEQTAALAFHPVFVAELGDAFYPTLMFVRGMGPFTVDSTVLHDDGVRVRAVAQDGSGAWNTIQLAIDPEAPDVIAGFGVWPSPEADPNWVPAESWDDLAAALGQSAERVSVLAAHVNEGACQSIYSFAGDEQLAIGSTFKLYILSALVDAVERGEISWEDLVAIDEGLKSIPTGEMHNEAAGTEFTMQHMAGEMIRISDNTATDHMLHLAGREAVEGVVEATGHGDPSQLIPFLTTMELFSIKLLSSPAVFETFMAADDEDQRAFVEHELEINRATVMFAASFWTAPRRTELEWNASTEDLCAVMARLREQAETEAGAPVREILSRNTGVGLHGDWSFIGYKGGSEPGVMNMTWWLEDADGAPYVVSITTNDTTREADSDALILAAHNALMLLAP